MSDRTDDFKQLSKLLNLPLEADKCISYACNFPLNDFQTLYVRLEGGRGGKAYAQISSNYDVRNHVYIDQELRYLNINFSSTKSIEAIAKDIKRRLLDSPDVPRQLEQLEASWKTHLAYEAQKNKRLDFLVSKGFRENSGETASFFEHQGDGRYLSIKAYTNRNELEFYGCTDEQFQQVIALLVSFNNEEEN